MKKIITLPVFSGFYGTHFECDCEETIIEDGKTSDDYEFDYKEYHDRVARACVGKVEAKLHELGLPCSITFLRLDSPREYNFRNDEIVVLIRLLVSDLKVLIKDVKENYLNEFEAYLIENHKSRDGFCSFIPHTSKEWFKTCLKKDYERFDCCLSSFLHFYLSANDYNDFELYTEIDDVTSYVFGELKL